MVNRCQYFGRASEGALRGKRVGLVAIMLALVAAGCSDDSSSPAGHGPLDAGGDSSMGNPGAIDAGSDASLDAHVDSAAGDAAPNRADGSTSSTANLIVNGNAEAAAGSADGTAVSTPPWTATGNATALMYGVGDYPSAASASEPDPGPPDRGTNLFIGGADDELSTLSQRVSLAAYRSAIDAGGVTFQLEGWLGGFGSQEDNATLAVTFRDVNGVALGTGAIGPVTATDRVTVTSLLERSATGVVPKGASTVDVLLTLTRLDGAANDGYADDLSLDLIGI
ncbi:MAG: hypothetical protein JWN04_3170 [Myxococcaceae bacterium]|nr:hypothetical protein [Myxococcaceae bacterium]